MPAFQQGICRVVQSCGRTLDDRQYPYREVVVLPQVLPLRHQSKGTVREVVLRSVPVLLPIRSAVPIEHSTA